MRIDEREAWDGEEPRREPYVDGELQNLAAFGSGLARLSGPRRTAAKVVVWLLLLSVVLTVIYGVLGIIDVR